MLHAGINSADIDRTNYRFLFFYLLLAVIRKSRLGPNAASTYYARIVS